MSSDDIEVIYCPAECCGEPVLLRIGSKYYDVTELEEGDEDD